MKFCFHLFFLIFITLFLASCSIEKRLHLPGYHIKFKTKANIGHYLNETEKSDKISVCSTNVHEIDVESIVDSENFNECSVLEKNEEIVKNNLKDNSLKNESLTKPLNLKKMLIKEINISMNKTHEIQKIISKKQNRKRFTKNKKSDDEIIDFKKNKNFRFFVIFSSIGLLLCVIGFFPLYYAKEYFYSSSSSYDPAIELFLAVFLIIIGLIFTITGIIFQLIASLNLNELIKRLILIKVIQDKNNSKSVY
jgi:hypothetical protein